MTRISGAIGGISGASLARFQLAGLSPIIATIGDSISTPDYNGSNQVAPSVPVNLNKGAAGFTNWALALSGHRVEMPDGRYVWAFPSQETGTILANLPAFLAQLPHKPGVVVVECGTNNIGHAGATGTFESITADWEAISTYLVQRGIRVIFVPILPRGAGFSALFAPSQFETMDRCNRWLSAFAGRSQGVVAVASACLPRLTNPASVGAQPKSGMMVDGTHPGVQGAFHIGKAIADILKTWFPPVDLLPASNLIWADGLTDVSLIRNPMMQGNGGTVTQPASGTLSGTAPDNWVLSMSNTAGLTIANARVVSPLSGNVMHQMTFGGNYTASGVTTATWAPWARLYMSATTGANAVIEEGDAIEALMEVEIDAGHNCIAFPRLEMRWKGSAMYNSDMQIPDVVGVLPGDEPIRMVLRTAAHHYAGSELPLANGELALGALAYLRAEDGTYEPTGSIRFGRAVIRKV